MNGIHVREKENIEKALRRFKKVCEDAGVISEVKKFQSYEKPSEEKRRKLKAAKRSEHVRRLKELKNGTMPYKRKKNKK